MSELPPNLPRPLTFNNEPFYWPIHCESPTGSLSESQAQESLAGSGHAVLMLHGLGGGSYELRPIAERLHAQGLTVQGINYPGHVEPASRMAHSTWPEWYAHAEETYLALAQSHRHVSLVGFSTGCPLALRLALQHPVSRLVLLSPFLEIKRQFFMPLERLVHPVSRVVPHVPRFTLPIRDRESLRQSMALSVIETFNLRTVCSALELIREIKPKLGEVQNPTLIIQSRRDSVVDPRGAHYLMQHLGSTHKSVHWLQQSDHIIPLDVERETVFTLTETFLQEAIQLGQPGSDPANPR
jgi:carboxylesterase